MPSPRLGQVDDSIKAAPLHGSRYRARECFNEKAGMLSRPSVCASESPADFRLVLPAGLTSGGAGFSAVGPGRSPWRIVPVLRGRGTLPSMMSLIISSSMVSYLNQRSDMVCSLSILVWMIL